eukprot:s1283_g5.t1
MRTNNIQQLGAADFLASCREARGKLRLLPNRGLCFSIRCEAPMRRHILTVLADVVVFTQFCRHAEAMSHHTEVLSDGSIQKDSALVMRREMNRANECWRGDSWTSECPKYDQTRCTSYTETECTSSCGTGQICLKLQMSPVSYTCCTDTTASGWSTSASVTTDKAKPPASQELQDDATHSDEEKASSHKKSGEPGKDDTRSRDSDKESDDKRPLEDKLSALEKKKREAEDQVKKLERERQRLATEGKESESPPEKSQVPGPHQEAGPEEPPHEESGAPNDAPFSGGRAFEAQIFGEKLDDGVLTQRAG